MGLEDTNWYPDALYVFYKQMACENSSYIVCAFRV
jgi:hypothetical protein